MTATVTIDQPPRRRWLLPGIIIGVMAAAGLIALVLLRGGSAGMPSSFPNAVIPLSTAGTPADIRIVRSSIAPGPGEVDGVACWPAWQCLNADCPGRGADHQPFIFPYGERPSGKDGPWPICPRCAAAKDRRRDPTNIAQYFTDEALTLMKPAR